MRKAQGIIVSVAEGCSGMYPGVRELLVCLGLISRAVAAAGPQTQHFCHGIVAGDGQTWLYPATRLQSFTQFTQKGEDGF